jgi:hypothetical protein
MELIRRAFNTVVGLNKSPDTLGAALPIFRSLRTASALYRRTHHSEFAARNMT